MAPRLSVIIPTRNRCSILAGVLEAYLAQAVEVGAEVLVMDDGSTDDTPALLSASAGQGIPLRWESAPHRGPAAARNRGIEQANASLLVFTGDDMFPQPGLLEGHLRAHDALRGSAVVGHIRWDPALRASPLMRCMAPNGPLFNFRKLVRSRANLYRFFYTANLSMATETLGDQRFHEGFTAAAFEDTELGFRLERSGVSLVYRPDLVVYHRHAMSARDLVRRLKALREGRLQLWNLHPELRPGMAGRTIDAALVAAVTAWAPLESMLSLRPRGPRGWTEGHA